MHDRKEHASAVTAFYAASPPHNGKATIDSFNAILQVDAPVFRRAMVDFDGLSGDDQMKIHNYLIALFLIVQTEVKLSARGLGELSDYPPVLASWTRAPGIQKWWSMVGPSFSSDFHVYINELRELGMDKAPIHESQPWVAANLEQEI